MSTNPYESPESVPKPTRQSIGQRLAVVTPLMIACGAVLLSGAFLIFPVRRIAPEAARGAQCINNLKQIGLALRNYEELFDSFPPAYTVDANGSRLHSWRTLILPFMDEGELYDKIDFSKPWNDPANKAAFNTVVPAYVCPSLDDIPPGHTTYLAVDAPDGVFQGATGRTIKEVTDDHGATLLVAEVEEARHVHWMSPEDADLDWLLALDKIEELPHNGVNVLWLDGRATHLVPETSKEKLRAFISIAGGDDDVLRESD